MLFALAIGAYVATNPGRRTVTPTYRIAVKAWFAGERLYNTNDIGGFLYFPHAALAYLPFTALPYTIGEIVWRCCGLALLVTALWRLAALIASADRLSAERLFLLFTLLCLPATVSAARNGQMNLHLGALMLHATADVVVGVWWRAALALTAALALKPHAIVPLLLAAALYPRTRVWLAVMVAAAAAALFLFQRPGYVVEQYLACFRRIAVASVPPTDTWSDLRGLLIRLGVEVSNTRLIIVRVAAAVPTLMLALQARRHGAVWAASYTFALGATYLMLFIPRTEANSYVILAPAVAALAARSGTGVAFWALVGFAIALGCENYGRSIHEMTDLWLKPLLTIVFAVYLIFRITAATAGSRAQLPARLERGTSG